MENNEEGIPRLGKVFVKPDKKMIVRFSKALKALEHNDVRDTIKLMSE